MLDDWFDIIIGGEDVIYYKFDFEGLLFVIDWLKVCFEEVLYIGDSIVDVGIVVVVGVFFIGVISGMIIV